MLRILKQKIHENDETLGIKQALQNNAPQTVGDSSSLMVSHVPVSVASQTTGTPSSTASSISSLSVQTEVVGLALSDTRSLSQDSNDESSRQETRNSVKCLGETPVIETEGIIKSNKKHRKAGQSSFEPSPKRAKFASDARTNVHRLPATPVGARTPMALLACQQDEKFLNPLHTFVRKQIEVFTATAVELRQPAPGRKQPIKLNQVGLRCIHCKHLPNRKRVKRGVCYPSSVARIYHSVSDMKFDHFNHCKELPPHVREHFKVLKAAGQTTTEPKMGQRNSSSSIAQYYHDTAVSMGLADISGGIFPSVPLLSPGACQVPLHHTSKTSQRALHGFPVFDIARGEIFTPQRSPVLFQPSLFMNILAKTVAKGSEDARKAPIVLQRKKSCAPHSSKPPVASSKPVQKDLRVVAEDSDREFVNDIHQFVRKHIEFFTADNADILAPSPGRKTRVLLGQVGIRCIHCARFAKRTRVKRAVCYPPSIRGIYHSVSNMKFDHFGICPSLPPDVRSEFMALRAACNRRGTAGNVERGSFSSTAQYYRESAVRKGLVDTTNGIRFQENKTQEKRVKQSSNSAQASEGLLALVRAASQAS